mmetsp:Transcript_78194/g.172556  ORF Transcript_78194/g.172556 Transcript_78194/m.172556 type:complete len:212 (-) Transcript_78194:273-908(-)
MAVAVVDTAVGAMVEVATMAAAAAAAEAMEVVATMAVAAATRGEAPVMARSRMTPTLATRNSKKHVEETKTETSGIDMTGMMMTEIVAVVMTMIVAVGMTGMSGMTGMIGDVETTGMVGMVDVMTATTGMSGTVIGAATMTSTIVGHEETERSASPRSHQHLRPTYWTWVTHHRLLHLLHLHQRAGVLSKVAPISRISPQPLPPRMASVIS